MQVRPLMDIRFSGSKESQLIASMRRQAEPPWGWQEYNPHGKPPEEDAFYFHRDSVDQDPPCTLCIYRKDEGHLVVHGIIPDANTTASPIAIDQYVRILREFDERIAEPAANDLGGMTTIDTAMRTLDDYFSPEAVQLLERFCAACTPASSHPSDQKKWMAFLLCVHHDSTDVHCDTFGACLKAKEWWPEDGVDDLVSEYDFAMQLLRYAAESDG